MIHSRPRSWAIGMLLVWLVVVIGFPAAVPSAAAQEKPTKEFTEEEVKAAFLLTFARFTDWPTNAFSADEKTFVIGIYLKDSLGDKATRIFKPPAAVKGRKIAFRVVTEVKEARECQILFVPRSERRRTDELFERLKGAPVLTIGEYDEFLDSGGMINLIAKDGSMQFEINLNPAKEARLRIPGKVLEKAQSVKGKYD